MAHTSTSTRTSTTSPRGPVADASVRVARETDAPAVGLVQADRVAGGVCRGAASRRSSRPSTRPRSPGRGARRWPLLREGVHRLLAACAGEQVVGFASVGPSQDPDASPLTGELTAIAVHPQARRSGHGSRLLNAAVDTLRGAGADTLHAWLLASDEETRAFFVRAGLAPDGAFRDRVVSPDGQTAREVRLSRPSVTAGDAAPRRDRRRRDSDADAMPRPRRPRAGGMTTLAPARRRAVLRQSLSVGVATGAYGMSFGALSTAAGLSLLQTQALSLLLFSGGSQFAFVGLVAGGMGGAPAAIATSTLLGVRNGLYGLQVAQLLQVSGLRRAVAAHLTIDESTAVGVAQPEERAGRLGFWATGVAVFALWNLMTLVGAVMGDALGDPRTYGLDAAAAAAFCGLLWPRLKSATRWPSRAGGPGGGPPRSHAPAGVPVLVAADRAAWRRVAATGAGGPPRPGRRRTTGRTRRRPEADR